MGILTITAKVIYQLLPDNRVKKHLTAAAFRVLYRGKIKDYRYHKGIFTLKMDDGMEIRSVKDFDPAPLLENFLHTRLKKGASVIDLGGNLGIVSIFLSRRIGKQGRVFTFEPDENNYKLLTQNILLNRVENIIPVKKGIWNRNGTLEFFSGGNYTSSFHKTDFVEKQKEKYRIKKVTVVKLDNAVKDLKIKKLDLVKIDIEGSEIQALEGGTSVIRKFKPDLIVETHIIADKSTAEGVRELLNRFGYKKILAYGEKSTPTIFAKYK